MTLYANCSTEINVLLIPLLGPLMHAILGRANLIYTRPFGVDYEYARSLTRDEGYNERCYVQIHFFLQCLLNPPNTWAALCWKSLVPHNIMKKVLFTMTLQCKFSRHYFNMGTYTHPYKVKLKAACKLCAAAAIEGSVGAGEGGPFYCFRRGKEKSMVITLMKVKAK